MQSIIRRLQLLYHHGYLERPSAQIDYYRQGGSHHIIYGLGNKGGMLLRQEMGDTFRDISWGEKNRSVRRVYLEHSVAISDFMVALELDCRKRGIHLIGPDAFHLPNGEPVPHPITWKVKINSERILGIIPDRVFSLESSDQSSNRKSILYFLEVDRGTMPIVRKNLSQTSFYRKILAYEATWSQELHQTQFGFHRFRVLTVTKSQVRVQSLVSACSKLKRGHGLFLFTDESTLQTNDDIFTILWKTGHPGQTDRIFN